MALRCSPSPKWHRLGVLSWAAGFVLLTPSLDAAGTRKPKTQLEQAERLLRDDHCGEAGQLVEASFAALRGLRGTSKGFLARAYVLRALVAACQDRPVDAGLEWSTAVVFDPKVGEIGLQVYGNAAKKLAEATAMAFDIGKRAQPRTAPGLKLPVLLADHRPVFQRWSDCRKVQITVDGWLDETGRLRGIRGASSTCDDAFILSAIESLRQRKYSAAQDSADKPVAIEITVKFNLSVSYSSSPW